MSHQTEGSPLDQYTYDLLVECYEQEGNSEPVANMTDPNKEFLAYSLEKAKAHRGSKWGMDDKRGQRLFNKNEVGRYYTRAKLTTTAQQFMRNTCGSTTKGEYLELMVPEIEDWLIDDTIMDLEEKMVREEALIENLFRLMDDAGNNLESLEHVAALISEAFDQHSANMINKYLSWLGYLAQRVDELIYAANKQVHAA